MRALNRLLPAEALPEGYEGDWGTEVARLMEELEAMRAHHASLSTAVRDVLTKLCQEPPPTPRPVPGVELPVLVAAYERSLVLWALAHAGGQQRDAARLLGVRPTTLNEMMKRLGIVRPLDGAGIPGH